MNVIIKPLVSEKMTKMTENHNRYGFIVNKKANKIDPSFDGFKGEIMTLIEKTSQFSLKETNNNLNTLKDYLSQLESLLKKLNVDDEFKQKSIKKYEELEKKLKFFIENVNIYNTN